LGFFTGDKTNKGTTSSYEINYSVKKNINLSIDFFTKIYGLNVSTTFCDKNRFKRESDDFGNRVVLFKLELRIVP
jgi:hypothetical protein